LPVVAVVIHAFSNQLMSDQTSSRPKLTTEQWRQVFARVDERDVANASPSLSAAKDADPNVAEALKFFFAARHSAAPETFSFAGIADEIAGAPRVSSGQRCGNYELIEPIGRGGMGSVWRARRSDGLYDAEVAVKLLGTLALSAHARARFAREGQLLSRLTHPNIARLLDAGVTEDGQRFLVLELVDGADIAAYCQDRSERDVISVFQSLLAAVAYAHSQLVLHRDIKPSNVLVNASGAVKLLDFGVAKLVDETAENATESDDLTRMVGHALTEAYAAPEQINGGTVGTQSDVFALGSLLIELLLAERIRWTRPKREWSARSGAVRIENDLARLHPDLRAVLLKSVAVDMQDRYATVIEFADDLSRYASARPVRARAVSRWYRLRRFVGRNRLAVGAGSAAAAAVIASLALATWQLSIARSERASALRETARAQGTTKFLKEMFLSAAARARDTNAPPPTLLQVLDSGLAQVRRDSSHDVDTRLALLGALAEVYGTLDTQAAGDRFVEVNQERIALARTHYGEKHAVVYEAKMIDIGADVYSGNFAAAKKSLLELESVIKDEPLRSGSRDERYAVRLETRAAIERGLAEESLPQVLSRYEAALTEFRNVNGNQPTLDHATTLANTAKVLQRLGRLDDALSSVRAAITMMKAIPSDASMDQGNLAGTYALLANMLAEAKQHDEAGKAFDQAIAMQTKLAGESHPITLNMRLSRAKWLHQTGHRDAAWREFEIIAKFERAPTANIFDLHEQHFVRGQLLIAESRFDEAASALALAVEGWKSANNNPQRLQAATALLTEANAQAASQSPKR
jgi:eukaryotic-like serine/threonine-protein kinase